MAQKTKTYIIKRGLDLKLSGLAEKKLIESKSTEYAISPSDFKWVIPKLCIAAGDNVKIGTTLFTDKTDERLKFVSPISGTIKEIVRGEKRKIERIVISSDDKFETEIIETASQNKAEITDTLLKYGLWTFIKQRPFNIIANPDETPKSIFVSCFDSAPLAPDYNYILQTQISDFCEGLKIISKLTDGKIHLCLNQKADNTLFESISGVEIHYFSGKHPAGNVGTQIHHIDPINKGDKVWSIEPQNIASIGKLFSQKKLDFTKIISLNGSGIKKTAYYKIINGIYLSEMLNENLTNDESRVISGNVLTGKKIEKDGFIGFYDNCVTVIPEGGQREFIGWLKPNLKKWSFSHTFLAWLTPNKTYNFKTSIHGGRRTLIMTDIYDKVFPFDILPLPLIKACITKDIDLMEDLGIYEVVEEDFALCELICPSKLDWQQIIAESHLLLK